jgi:hypothetical protein
MIASFVLIMDQRAKGLKEGLKRSKEVKACVLYLPAFRVHHHLPANLNQYIRPYLHHQLHHYKFTEGGRCNHQESTWH